jgi:hypothetical protein
MTANASPDNRWLFKTGGLCTFVLGLAYVATVVLYFSVGKLPADGAAWLTFLGGKTALWWTITGLSVLTDLLFIPLALALYAALSRTSRLPSLIPLALMALWVPLDLAGTWSHYASLITLSGRYAAATAAQRAPIVAAADYGAAFLGSRLEAVFTTGLLSFAILLVSVVMRKSGFGKTASWSGIGGGFFGMLAVTGWNLPVLLNVIGVGLWVFLVSFRLYFGYFGDSAAAPARPAADLPVQVTS